MTGGPEIEGIRIDAKTLANATKEWNSKSSLDGEAEVPRRGPTEPTQARSYDEVKVINTFIK